MLSVLGGLLVLVPGLLVRNEYTESMFARILVTIGVIAVLLPVVVPEHGEIPLVSLFKGLIDAPGEHKVKFILDLALIVLVVLSLLVWMPGPATGGAKVFAWLLILYPVAVHVVTIALGGHYIDFLKASPFGMVAAWVPRGRVRDLLRLWARDRVRQATRVTWDSDARS